LYLESQPRSARRSKVIAKGAVGMLKSKADDAYWTGTLSGLIGSYSRSCF
jgi:hypothetical protein